jgi:hypothetical protein
MLLGAQQPPPSRPPVPPVPAADSTKRSPAADTIRKSARPDTGAAQDSTKPDSAKRAAAVRRPPPDTIKTPTARPYTPRSTEIGPNRWHWDRDAMFASGAFTLGELLAQVPGVTLFTTGFILAPEVAGWYGNPNSVRVFIDGVERDPINARNNGVTDLSAIPMWAFEDVKLERTAGELRVHLRTWRVDRTTPTTRTDIFTGSENLNLYRGFLGMRLGNGGVIQLAGQQESNVTPGGMDGDGLGALARIGWARGSWDVDATLLRQGVNRNAGDRFLAAVPQLNVLPPFKGTEGLAYLRLAWRDPETDGPWVQLIASTIYAGENNGTSRQANGAIPTSTATAAPTDTVDTTASRSQYVVAAGITKWGLRLSTTNRVRSIGRKTYVSPGARAEYESKVLTVSAFGERGVDSTTRTDVQARFAPLSWFNVGASLSRAAPRNAALGPAALSTRLEAGVRLRDRWFSGGLVTRGASLVAPPVELDSALGAVNAPAARGVIAGVHGPIWRGLALDLDAIKWSNAGPYRPQTEMRTRLWFQSSFLGRFPRGTFHLFVSATHEYRTTTFVPLGTDPTGQSTPGYSSLGTLLEIRIGTAVISWETRNILAQIYETYPGYVIPRLVNLYGVRWEFWN